MPVISTPACVGEDVLVYDTFIAGKRVVTAIVESADDAAELTACARKTVDCADAHHRMAHRLAGDWAPVRAASVHDAAIAKDKVVETLSLASDGSLILFFTRSDDVRAAFVAALGVRP